MENRRARGSHSFFKRRLAPASTHDYRDRMKVHLHLYRGFWMTATAAVLIGRRIVLVEGQPPHAHHMERWRRLSGANRQVVQDQGNHFLALSDHNTLQVGERWVDVMNSRGGPPALKVHSCVGGRLGATARGGWSSTGPLTNSEEFRKRLEEPNRFLMIQSRITDRWKTAPVHMNATNLRHKITPQGGDSVYDVMQRNMNALLAQRKATGQPMFLHLNHPNFGWGVTAEELMRVKGERFFEVYNGHPSVRDLGDATHASTERMWDIINTRRLTELKLGLLYGLATDDAHNYHGMAANRSNTAAAG